MYKYNPLTLEYLEYIKPRYEAKGYPVPKWIQFLESMLEENCKVSLYDSKSTVSKYLIVSKNNLSFKVRFSNHKANVSRESRGDCDYYVGWGNFGVIKTEEVIEELRKKFNGIRVRSNWKIAETVLHNRRIKNGFIKEE